jgi:predicted acylesterase/phospholipase RssA
MEPGDVPPNPTEDRPDGGAVEPVDPHRQPLLYEDLRAPQPVSPSPAPAARGLAFLGILVGGLLGGLIGWGVADLLTEGALWPAVGGLVGASGGALGVGIIAALTLRAMSEWTSVRHPEGE